MVSLFYLTIAVAMLFKNALNNFYEKIKEKLVFYFTCFGISGFYFQISNSTYFHKVPNSLLEVDIYVKRRGNYSCNRLIIPSLQLALQVESQ